MIAAIDQRVADAEGARLPKVIFCWRFMAPKNTPLASSSSPTLQTGVFGARGSDKAATSSRTADVHHIAIALGCIGIDKSRYQQPTINGNDFAILFSASRSRWTDIVFPAWTAL